MDESCDPQRPQRDSEDPAITFTAEGDGRSTRVELWVDGRSISRCWIVRQRIRIGRSVVRMDGIGGVGTETEYRLRGYAARVLWAAVRQMQSADACLSMLYGIADFYERFGYTQAGPEHAIIVPPDPAAELPTGWSLRPACTEDLPALRRIYDEVIRASVGAVVRQENAYPWRTLARRLAEEDPRECILAVGPDGSVGGYLRRGRGFWAVDVLERDEPGYCVWGEAMAIAAEAAEAILAYCARNSFAQDGTRLPALLPVPHDTPIAHAAMRRSTRLVRAFSASGGSMAVVLDAGRLLEGMKEELLARLRDAGVRLSRPLIVETEDQIVCMGMVEGGLRIEGGVTASSAITAGGTVWRTDRSQLAKLALGALPPEEVLSRSSYSTPPRVRQIVSALFPMRYPHMYLPDRY